MHHDYFPRGDAPFLVWVKNFITSVLLYLIKWGLPPDCLDRMKILLKQYDDALEVAHDARHNSQDIAKKNEAKDALEAEVRHFVGMYIAYNKLVTDDERVVCRLPIRDKHLTPAANPTSCPVLWKVDHPAQGRIRIWIHDSVTGRSTKPDKVHGYEIRYKVSHVRVEHWSELDQSTFATRSPAMLQFDDYQLGQIVSFSMRYENTRGVKGPWSEIYYVIIS
jgi:hypothetical protein